MSHWEAFTPLILGAGKESCLSWVCLCLCLSALGHVCLWSFYPGLGDCHGPFVPATIEWSRLLPSLFTSLVILVWGLWAQRRWLRCSCQHYGVRRQDSALSHGHVPGSFPPWFVAALPLIATLAMV